MKRPFQNILFFCLSRKAFLQVYFYTSQKIVLERCLEKLNKCLANTQTSWWLKEGNIKTKLGVERSRVPTHSGWQICRREGCRWRGLVHRCHSGEG